MEEPREEGNGPETGEAEDLQPGSEEARSVDEDLDALLAGVQRERDEYLELAQRARADFENYRRRVAGEAADAERRGKSGLARDLLPALDSLERALLAAGVDPGGPTADGEQPSQEVSAHTALAEGVALVFRELRSALERAGVRSFDPTGEPFDPGVHEAIATTASEGVDTGVVIETLDKGYRLGEQVIRPARVVVAE